MATTYGNKVFPGVNDGSSSTKAAPSALALKLAGYETDGVYWINLPTVGPQQVYCLLDGQWDGGGWMMAMKATRGTTFNYDANYWTTNNTLNTTAVNQNDGDAKFDVMNYFAAKDIMARWPDITTTPGGSIPYTGTWTWLQNNFNDGSRIVPITFFNTSPKKKIADGKAFSGWASGVFSSQDGFRWYGFNYENTSSPPYAKVRWGFGWNNENQELSNDVTGGIGIETPPAGFSPSSGYSAGDVIWSFPPDPTTYQDTTGINRSARVEVYVR